MSAEHSLMAAAQAKDSPGRANPIRCRYLRFGPFQVDLQRQQLSRNGVRVKLYGKAYQVLLLLLEKPGEVVTREQIRQRLWHSEADVNVDANINTTVNRVRLILKDGQASSAYIDTIPRKGYSFVGQVEFSDISVPAVATALETESGIVEGSNAAASRRDSHIQWTTMAANMLSVVVPAIILGFVIATFWPAEGDARSLVLLAAVCVFLALVLVRGAWTLMNRMTRSAGNPERR